MSKQELQKLIEAEQVNLTAAKADLSKASGAYKKSQKKLADLYKQHFSAK